MWLITLCNGMHQWMLKDCLDSQSLLNSQSQPQVRRLRTASQDQCCLHHQQLPLQSSLRLLGCPLSRLDRRQKSRSQQQQILRVLMRHGQGAVRSRYQEVKADHVTLTMETCLWRSKAPANHSGLTCADSPGDAGFGTTSRAPIAWLQTGLGSSRRRLLLQSRQMEVGLKTSDSSCWQPPCQQLTPPDLASLQAGKMCHQCQTGLLCLLQTSSGSGRLQRGLSLLPMKDAVWRLSLHQKPSPQSRQGTLLLTGQPPAQRAALRSMPKRRHSSRTQGQPAGAAPTHRARQ